MEEHVGPSTEAGPLTNRDLEGEARSILENVRNDEQFRALGLSVGPEDAVRAVLCAAWRNLPLRQLDELRSLLPACIELMFGNCELPAHARHSAPRTFVRDTFIHDVAEHLGVTDGQALTVATRVFQVLRPHMEDVSVQEADLFGASPELMEFLQRRV